MDTSSTPSPSAAESHLLYVLLDSNLPTGGFVASSGLESYAKHGLLSPLLGEKSTAKKTQDAVLNFVDESLRNYASGTMAFVRDAWNALDDNIREEGGEFGVTDTLRELDNLYEAMTLNHVTRRSSTAQGIALLTLFSKSLAGTDGHAADAEEGESQAAVEAVEHFRRMIRKGETFGHLPVCWGLLTRASGLGLGRSQFPAPILLSADD